jgi:hypothetical protein
MGDVYLPQSSNATGAAATTVLLDRVKARKKENLLVIAILELLLSLLLIATFLSTLHLYRNVKVVAAPVPQREGSRCTCTAT